MAQWSELPHGIWSSFFAQRTRGELQETYE
jgi:hypothetical protein